MIGLRLILSTLVLSGCDSTDPDPDTQLKVLFVGNSLTYTNNLPAMVARMAETGADKTLEYEMVAFPNFSLEDHWNEGSARQSLSDGGFDFVVMQQGPSSLPENQEDLKTWSEKFAVEARTHGTEPALLTVWPDAGRSFAFPNVIAAYAAAAEAVDGLLLPAGEAWTLAWEEDAALALYGPDNFHPSQMGTYLAALVVYAGLFDESPRQIPSTLRLEDGVLVEIPSASASLLQSAAADALAD